MSVEWMPPTDDEPTQGPGSPSTHGTSSRLLKAALGSFGLNVFNAAATILTAILLARVMGVAEFGVYALVVATITLLGVPAILGLDRLLTRDIAVHHSVDAHGLARGLLLRSQQLAIGTSVALGTAGAVVVWLGSGGRLSAELLAFWAGFAALPFLALGRVVQAGLMGFHHVILGQAPELFLRPLLFLIMVVAVLAATNSLDAPLAVSLHALSLLGATLVSIALLRRHVPAAIRRARPVFRTREWTASAVALAFLSGAMIVNSQTGVVLLGSLEGPEASGLYAAAQRGALLIAFPLAAVNSAIAPMAARLWASSDVERLQRLVTLSARGLLLVSFPLAMAFIFFGRPLLGVAFGAEFVAADGALAILALGQVVNAATGSVGTVLVMSGNQRRAAVGITLGAIVNVTLGIVFIPMLGVAGAALAAACGLVVANILLVSIARRTLGIDSTPLGRVARTVRSD